MEGWHAIIVGADGWSGAGGAEGTTGGIAVVSVDFAPHFFQIDF